VHLHLGRLKRLKKILAMSEKSGLLLEKGAKEFSIPKSERKRNQRHGVPE